MDPLTIMMGVQGLAEWGNAVGQYQQTERDYLANRANAAVARDLKIQSLNRRAIQEAEATAGQKFDLAIASMEAREARTVASGEAGLAGKTIDAQRDMVTARQLRGETVLNDNLRMTLDQIEDEKAGYNAEMLNRINSLPRGQKPNILAHALSTAANMYAAEVSMTGKNPFSSTANPMATSNAVMPNVTPIAKPPIPSPLPTNNQNALFFVRNF